MHLLLQVFFSVKFLIQDLCTIRFGISEKYVGVAAGFLVGGYSAAVFCSSFFMGYRVSHSYNIRYLSDRFGRKPLMLTGSGLKFLKHSYNVAVGAICIFCFGITPWYYLALALRLIAGMKKYTSLKSSRIL